MARRSNLTEQQWMDLVLQLLRREDTRGTDCACGGCHRADLVSVARGIFTG